MTPSRVSHHDRRRTRTTRVRPYSWDDGDRTSAAVMESQQYHPSNKTESCQNGTHTLEDYCEVSTCAGAIDWYRAKSVIGKSFWTLILLITLSVTAWQLYEAFKDFADPDNRFETVVTIKANLGGNPFPNVTVCNFNRVDKKKMLANNITDESPFQYAFSTLPVIYHLPVGQAQQYGEFLGAKVGAENITNVNEIYTQRWKNFVDEHYEGNEPTVTQLLEEYGHDCDKTVLTANFQNEQFRNVCIERAGVERSMTPLITNFGKCYTFRWSDKYQAFPGASMGLQMIIDPGLESYLNDSLFSNYLEEGILLSFSYDDESVLTTPIVVSPGTHAFVGLKLTKQVYKREPYPIFELPCKQDAMLRFMQGNYTKNLCNYECFVDIINGSCGCIPPMRAKPGVAVCNTTQAFHCSVPLMSNLSHVPPDVQEALKGCQDDCLDSCRETVTVIPQVTTTAFPSASLVPNLQQLMKQMLGEHAKDVQNFIAIDAYFPVMEIVMVTTSEATPVFTFIGNIGGQLGMWTGMCIMTVVQAGYFIVAILCEKCCGTQKKRTHVISIEKRSPVQNANNNFSKSLYYDKPTVIS